MRQFDGSLDANILLRLILNDVPAHHKMAVRLLSMAKKQYAVSDVAIIEVVFVLLRNYDFTRLQVREAVEGIISLKEIHSNRLLIVKALDIFVAHPKLSFEDCYMAVYAEHQGATPLWTFDQKLARQATPAQLLS